jgi:hypothetical protein
MARASRIPITCLTFGTAFCVLSTLVYGLLIQSPPPKYYHEGTHVTVTDPYLLRNPNFGPNALLPDGLVNQVDYPEGTCSALDHILLHEGNNTLGAYYKLDCGGIIGYQTADSVQLQK